MWLENDLFFFFCVYSDVTFPPPTNIKINKGIN